MTYLILRFIFAVSSTQTQLMFNKTMHENPWDILLLLIPRYTESKGEKKKKKKDKNNGLGNAD